MMSATEKDIVTRDRHGVVLRYSPGRLRPHHVERQPQVSDRRRNNLIAAERELLSLQIIAEHLDVSDIGMTRIHDALNTIRRALDLKRPSLGLATRTGM
jgi:hypothetical protein